MSELLSYVLASRPGRARQPLSGAALLCTPAVVGSQLIRLGGEIGQAISPILRDISEDGQDAEAVTGRMRALPSGSLVMTSTSGAWVNQASQYRDPRAYQAYIDEMACLP